MDENMRKESTISVSTRISVVDLARLDWMWSQQGKLIKSMSDLVRTSIEEMVNQLIRNEYISHGTIPTVLSAHKYLLSRGLYQASHLKRSKSRLNMALRFESMRAEGYDPSKEHPRAFNQIHSEHSVNTSEYPSYIDDEEWARIQREKSKERQAKYHASREDTIKNAEDSGVLVREGMSEKELDEHDARREEERQRLENQPPDLSNIQFADE